MKMWFKGSCFFRNFPHWGTLLSHAQSMPGLPGPGAMQQQWHCGAEARLPLSLGTRQLCTSLLVGTGMLAVHTTFPYCFLILACQEWGKMWYGT